ncbi:putative cytochrome P450 [Whalleya microplaca]|nr:putative cytochrome P450 [Whalleya microplaca]
MDTKGLQTEPYTFSVSLFTTTNFIRLVGCWLVYRVVLNLYNLSPFHPLYRFPGPRLAACSYLYEFWFDFILHGRYTHEIKKMHKKYGPIVRINPEELHCDDPDFTDEIYAGSGRVRDKQQHYLNTVHGPLASSSFATVSHETHRIRRSAVNKFFSRAQMMKLEPEIHDLAQQLCDKILRWNKEPLNMIDVFNCFTADTISQYAYGEPLGFLAQPAWTPNLKKAFEALASSSYLFKFLPVARMLIHLAPSLARYMPGDVSVLTKEMTENIPGHINRAIQGRSVGRIFSGLIDSPLPDSEKTLYRLSGEGISLMLGGTETTAWTLTIITYYLLTQKSTRDRLMEDLKDVDPKKLSWTSLERRPYLYAVIQEALRLSYGVSGRTPRIAREENLLYRKGKFEYLVPKGTPIGMSVAIMHHNEDSFPRSEEYIPERWLDKQGGKNYNLEKFLMSFNRGSRQCLGMNLAQCELYLVTTALALRVLPRMQLYETTADDLRYDHDLFTPQVKKGSKGVRVTVS